MIEEVDSSYWKKIQENLNDIRSRRKSKGTRIRRTVHNFVKPPAQRACVNAVHNFVNETATPRSGVGEWRYQNW
jgi:hypothetical protein